MADSSHSHDEESPAVEHPLLVGALVLLSSKSVSSPKTSMAKISSGIVSPFVCYIVSYHNVRPLSNFLFDVSSSNNRPFNVSIDVSTEDLVRNSLM
jgi:hypothetical protein